MSYIPGERNVVADALSRSPRGVALGLHAVRLTDYVAAAPLIKLGAVAGVSALAGRLGAVEPAVKPLRILILGGTGFTGPHQVRYALARGHSLTLFNRGRRPKEWPSHVEELTGDRDTGDLKSLAGREWDVCIDNPTSVPFWVRDAGAVLGGKVGHYVFISTISVFASTEKPGMDESAPLARYEGKDAMAETNAVLRTNMGLYGPLKAACEAEAEKQFPGKTTIIRPTLIAGPGDETDRFTYWPARLARGGDVLAPPPADPVQLIDARDLAEWTIRVAEQRALGIFNAAGPERELRMDTMIADVRALTPLTGWRNLPRGDLDALAQAVVAVSRLAALDAVREAEINPLIIHAEGAGVTVADAWIVPA
jgi:2'-hydroxyisoflavone reductase